MTATWALKPWQEHTMTATWALKAWKNSQQAQVLCCKLSSSTATGLLQGIVDFFLFAQEDFCLAWPLWSPHFLVFALALDMAFLVLPWPLLVWPLPFMAAGWVLAAGFLAALGFGLLELVLEPAHGAWSHPAEGNPQLPHGLCSGPRYPTAKVGPGPHLAGTQPWLHWQLASSWCQLALSLIHI